MKTRVLTLGATLAVMAARADLITDFGVSVGFGPVVLPPSTWTYDGPSSTLSGLFSNGNGLGGTFSSVMDFSGATQIRLTASTTSAAIPVDPFIFTLYSQTGATTSAVFNWADFASGTPVSVTRALSAFSPNDFQQVNVWTLRSVNNDSPYTVEFSLTLDKAETLSTPLPPLIGSSAIVTGFGSGATASAGWTYDPLASRLSGTPTFGDSLSGSLPYTSVTRPIGISLTAQGGNVAGAPFLFQILDANGAAASAAFDWSSFNGGTRTVVGYLEDLDTTNLDLNNLAGWRILNGSTGLDLDVTLFGASLILPPGSPNPVPEPAAALPVLALITTAGVLCHRRCRSR